MSIPQMMGQMAIQQMANRLQKQNPKMYQMLQTARQNGTSAEDLFNQVTKQYTPEQMNELLNQAEQYGISKDITSRFRK